MVELTGNIWMANDGIASWHGWPKRICSPIAGGKKSECCIAGDPRGRGPGRTTNLRGFRPSPNGRYRRSSGQVSERVDNARNRRNRANQDTVGGVVRRRRIPDHKCYSASGQLRHEHRGGCEALTLDRDRSTKMRRYGVVADEERFLIGCAAADPRNPKLVHRVPRPRAGLKVTQRERHSACQRDYCCDIPIRLPFRRLKPVWAPRHHQNPRPWTSGPF